MKYKMNLILIYPIAIVNCISIELASDNSLVILCCPFLIADRFRRSSINVLGRAKRRTLKMTITIGLLFITNNNKKKNKKLFLF